MHPHAWTKQLCLLSGKVSERGLSELRKRDPSLSLAQSSAIGQLLLSLSVHGRASRALFMHESLGQVGR